MVSHSKICYVVSICAIPRSSILIVEGAFVAIILRTLETTKEGKCRRKIIEDGTKNWSQGSLVR